MNLNKMSRNLRKNWSLLETIARNKNWHSRNAHIVNAVKNDTFHNCMHEICKNVVKRKVPLSLKDVSRLLKHKKSIRLIANKKTTKATRKKHIIQAGAGILPILIPIISTLLGSILQK